MHKAIGIAVAAVGTLAGASSLHCAELEAPADTPARSVAWIWAEPERPAARSWRSWQARPPAVTYDAWRGSGWREGRYAPEQLAYWQGWNDSRRQALGYGYGWRRTDPGYARRSWPYDTRRNQPAGHLAYRER